MSISIPQLILCCTLFSYSQVVWNNYIMPYISMSQGLTSEEFLCCFILLSLVINFCNHHFQCHSAQISPFLLCTFVFPALLYSIYILFQYLSPSPFCFIYRSCFLTVIAFHFFCLLSYNLFSSNFIFFSFPFLPFFLGSV